MGVFDNVEFGQSEVAMQCGDRLFIYSDGITEAINGNSEQFGTNRLVEFIRDHSQSPLQETLNHLLKSVDEWSGPNGLMDDVSCLSFEVL